MPRKAAGPSKYSGANRDKSEKNSTFASAGDAVRGASPGKGLATGAMATGKRLRVPLA